MIIAKIKLSTSIKNLDTLVNKFKNLNLKIEVKVTNTECVFILFKELN